MKAKSAFCTQCQAHKIDSKLYLRDKIHFEIYTKKWSDMYELIFKNLFMKLFDEN